jgi:small subunit ribosomal protein S11
MGKIKIVNNNTGDIAEPKGASEKVSSSSPAGTEEKKGKKTVKKISSGVLHIEATFNNTKVLFSDKLGNTLFASSSGSLGFKGAKKGTPFAASKVGDLIGTKAFNIGVKESGVIIKGVGSGREPVIRAFMAHGIEIISIKDVTPVPHNGPRKKKLRRV